MTRDERLVYCKEVYEWRKTRKMCVMCGKEKAQSGILFCLTCKMDKREAAKDYYGNLCEQKKREMLDRKKAVYYERKEQGLCTKCGQPAEKGLVLCKRHNNAQKLRTRLRYLKMQSLAAEVKND